MFYEVTLPFIYVMCLISEATTQHLYDNLANRKNHLMVNPFLLVFEVAFNERNEKNNTFCTSNILSFGILLSILGQDVKKFFVLTQFCTQQIQKQSTKKLSTISHVPYIIGNLNKSSTYQIVQVSVWDVFRQVKW